MNDNFEFLELPVGSFSDFIECCKFLAEISCMLQKFPAKVVCKSYIKLRVWSVNDKSRVERLHTIKKPKALLNINYFITSFVENFERIVIIENVI